MSGLLPEGLRRGDSVSLAARDRAPDSLTLALLAGALRSGLWCAVIGVPELGVAALAGMLESREAGPDGGGGGGGDDDGGGGIAGGVGGRGGNEGGDGNGVHAALDRLLLVPEPGERWAQVLAALAEAVDVLLVRPPATVPAELGRRIEARLRQGRGFDNTARGVNGARDSNVREGGVREGGVREGGLREGGTLRGGPLLGASERDGRHRAVLLVLGPWDTARLVLRTAETQWTGLDGVGPTAGTGHLTGCRATVVAEGRATAGRPRTARLWLPAADGTVRRLDDIPAGQRQHLTAVA